MTVRKRKWKDARGRMMSAYTVDVQIEMPGGAVQRVQKFSPVNSLRGAEEYERQIRGSIVKGSYGKTEARVPTFDEFSSRFLDWSETHNKPSTVYAKRWVVRLHLSPFFGSMALDAIRPLNVEEYKAQKLREEQNPKSVNNQLTVLRKLLNLAVEWEIIPHAPRLKPLKVAPSPFDFATFEELPRLLSAVAKEWATMATVASLTGLRHGELLGLKWEDVDLSAGRVVVRRTVWQKLEVLPKGGRTREVPLSDGCIAALKGHRALTQLKSAYVFCHPDGARLSHSEGKDVIPMACRKAGLAKRLTWHDLRHTFASHLVMRGASMKAVQELLGHATLEMTMRYAHLSPNVRRDTVRLLDGTYTAHEGPEKQKAPGFPGA